MKTKTFLTVTALLLIISAIGQRPAIELTFTATNNETYVQLDSIRVMNQTQECDTVLYWPDTVLVLNYYVVGIQEMNNEVESFQVFQNYPNPVENQTTISIFVPEKDEVGIIITDVMGRVVLKSDRVLDRGYHSFKYIPGEGGIYFFNAFWQGTSSSIKILTPGNGSSRASLLEYTGSKIAEPVLKKLEATQNFLFNLDDELLYIGYAETVEDIHGSDVIEDKPENDTLYTLDITEGVPCVDVPIVEITFKIYNTVQIGSQCWLKENLNRGTMILGILSQTDNGTIEKYCFDDDPANCDIYGGLYQWGEAMKYNYLETQGICPPGWHIPSDEEWKQLEGEVESQYDYPDPEWDKMDYRGFNIGRRLKTKTGWSVNNGNDYVGFSWLPSGTRRFDGVFLNMGSYSGIWSSTPGSSQGAWYRFTEAFSQQVARTHNLSSMGRPVRCLKD